jgi:hypothetical protein
MRSMTRNRWGATVGLGILALAAPTALAAAGAWQVTALTQGSSAMDVNATGVAAGYRFTGAAFVGVRFHDGLADDLAPLPEDVGSSANAINDAGVAVGFSYPADARSHAVAWIGATATDLGAGDQSEARDINDLGQVAGYRVLDGHVQAFRWDAGTVIPIEGTGWLNGFAWAINNSGAVVGSASLPDATGGSTGFGFLWEGGAPMDIGSLPGASSTAAMAINDNGQIAGLATFPDGTERVFVKTGTTFTALPMPAGDTLAQVFDMNNGGDVIGYTSGAGGTRPVLWPAAGGVVDLNSDLSGSGWRLDEVRGINDAGVIAGTGALGGVSGGVLVRPATAQTITFGALADVTYGQAPLTLQATATSGLPVAFAALGACSVHGSTLAITGAGACTVTATQPGDATWQAAEPVVRALAIARAPLDVVALDQQRLLGEAVSPTAEVRGLVAGDTVADLQGTLSVVVVGTPSATLPGRYAVRASGLSSPDYAIRFVDGSLTTAYRICPLYDPTKPMAGTSVAISLKLCNAAGTNLSQAGVTVTAVGLERAGTTVATLSTPFTYDKRLAGYTLSLSTKGLVTGQKVVYTVRFRVSTDVAGVLQAVTFTLR